MDATAARMVSRPCPECGAGIRYDDRFTPWCEQCQWNVDPYPVAEEPPGRLERYRQTLARRHGERLVSEISDGASLRPRTDVSSVLAQVLAVLVNGVTVALLILGLWFVVGGLGIVAMVLGALMLAMAVALRPHFARLPQHVPLLDRSSAPELFRLVDEVAAVVATRGIDTVAVNRTFNASVSLYGIRGRRLLTIGLPLWQILTPQERVALLGHELGHLGNGDLQYGMLVGHAFRSLTAWSYLFAPSEYAGNPIVIIVNIITFLPWIASEGVGMLLYRLTLRASQRGEYLADRYAARAGGTDAAIGLMDKLLLDSFVANSVGRLEARQQALGRARDIPRMGPDELWSRVADGANTIPGHELRRLRIAGARQGHAVDSSHPPTHLRRSCLPLATSGPPEVIIESDREARIASELSGARHALA